MTVGDGNGSKSVQWYDLVRHITQTMIVVGAMAAATYLTALDKVSGDAAIGILGAAMGAMGATLARRGSAPGVEHDTTGNG